MRGDRPSVGDRVVTVSPYGSCAPIGGTVTRVGRTLFDVSCDREQRARGNYPARSVSFRIETWLAAMRANEAGSPTRCYTEVEYAELPEREALLVEWRRWRSPDGISTDQLRRLVAILKERSER